MQGSVTYCGIYCITYCRSLDCDIEFGIQRNITSGIRGLDA